MLRCKQFIVPVNEQTKDQEPAALFCQFYGIPREELLFFEIQKKSLDARKKNKISHLYQICFETKDDARLLLHHGDLEAVSPKINPSPLEGLTPPGRPLAHPPVIVGSGPAGLFAALVLQAFGQPVILVERGEPVEKRIRTVGQLKRGKAFSGESNFCFGEGGAGTFSDGKLTCGRNHPLIQYVFHQLVQFGAPKSILYEAHPHIGTDYLLRVTKNIRTHLIQSGSQYLFGKKFLGFKQGPGSRYQVELSQGETLLTDHLILAIGHSARDTYQTLFELGVAMEQKPFAMGARLEHRQEDINRIQYGECPYLPPAEYKLAAQVGDRGIWTFCMCPGGFLLPTSAQEGHLAINGMSYHKRQSGFANAAIVVNVRREDYDRGHPLDGMRYQEDLEKRAFQAGGGNYFTPAQRVVDFLKDRPSRGELTSTYLPGLTPGSMNRILPDFVTSTLRAGLVAYNEKMPGYIKDTALIVGLESKTSAPISMTRTREFESISHAGLYPTGEGAGFAGGIVSAALDGVRVGQALCRGLGSMVG
jgi:uncharacterized FAD-dependent dehydrogenase